MPIITRIDYETAHGARELSQLTDRDGDGEADDEVFEQARDQAESLMGSYIAVRVRLPLPATLPDGSAQILRNLALAITRYYLFDQAPTDAVSTRYDQAMTWLKDFAKGLNALPGLSDAAPTSQSVGDLDWTTPLRVFSGATLSDF